MLLNQLILLKTGKEEQGKKGTGGRGEKAEISEEKVLFEGKKKNE